MHNILEHYDDTIISIFAGAAALIIFGSCLIAYKDIVETFFMQILAR